MDASTIRIIAGLTLLVGVPLYFLPSILAYRVTKKRNAFAIFMLNLFAGWTMIGWVGALAWSVMKDNPQVRAV